MLIARLFWRFMFDLLSKIWGLVWQLNCTRDSDSIGSDERQCCLCFFIVSLSSLLDGKEIRFYYVSTFKVCRSGWRLINRRFYHIRFRQPCAALRLPSMLYRIIFCPLADRWGPSPWKTLIIVLYLHVWQGILSSCYTISNTKLSFHRLATFFHPSKRFFLLVIFSSRLAKTVDKYFQFFSRNFFVTNWRIISNLNGLFCGINETLKTFWTEKEIKKEICVFFVY